ncbi:MAG: ABC-F family ATP-binding cassette domain-containing protein [Phenylobacterium sp.]|uniref:ABC-F family ATP-binding cassette domain-containing protein n=1 Tax=Phenylobacterium sp. TaxID=1871053 RepID=UPI00272338BC|nr:ABC-F family ATP-binding cassette domain-containing protein [Phenylobacterium sp.]MDO8901942.1 ABC-F family ATP-binding cassette domain-containing protein [Phenylobacterium sp.]
MPFVTLDSLCARTPDGRLLFDNLTLSLGHERTGLVGANGAGKSTLVRMILGESAPASGSVAVSGRIGVLRQRAGPPEGRVADLLGLATPLARLERIQRGEGSGADLDEADWTLEPRLAAALESLDLAGLDLHRPAASLSGGEATRAALAGLLVQAPDLLILDEPTNDLDAAGRVLVAEAVSAHPGGVLAISHDRALLRRMDRILDLTSLGPQIYGGGYDLYVARKAEAAAAATRALETAETEAARVAREVQADRERKARRDGAGRRFAARGSEPKILLGAQAERAENSSGRLDRLAERKTEAATDQLDAARARVEAVRRLGFSLPSSGLAQGKTVLAAEGLRLRAPDGRMLIDGLNLQIAGPERLALSGPNGSGKSTLLRVLTGQQAPAAGAVRQGVAPAIFDQQMRLLSPDETLLEAYLRLNPQADRNAAQAALARFLFRNRAAERKIAELSGGERLRAALACVLLRPDPPQLLVLDEPSNHLDLDSLSAVEAALGAYDGALLLVSHDRDFLAAVGVDREISLG